MEPLAEVFLTYYGLDWLALACGLGGTWLLGSMNPLGFLLSLVSCACGFLVAVLSSQYGFIFYNLILIGMMARGFMMWRQRGGQPQQTVPVRTDRS